MTAAAVGDQEETTAAVAAAHQNRVQTEGHTNTH